MMNDLIKAFIIDPEAIPARSSKDRLRVIHVGLMADENIRIDGRRKYKVENLSKQEKGSMDYKSQVVLWINHSGDLVGSCDCVARKLCKHIIEAVKVHQIAITAGFIKS